jgi:GTP-binding protein
MVFLDEVVITARSGDGGRGCVSFRRERFIPKGGPDGGDGGDGGDVIARVNRQLHTLSHFKQRRFFKAGNGSPGKGKQQSGSSSGPCIIEVPAGTVIQDDLTRQIVADLIHEHQEVTLLHGGKGGRGNQHFATSTRQTPRFAQPGLPGQEKRYKLTLKLLADIGLIGFPNVGKSTLLSRLTMARPKVDDYPFTTLFPNLGVIQFDTGRTLVIADIPGLIEGASTGRGLGDRFLKHIERTHLLVHILDITCVPEQDILEDFLILRREMAAFAPSLMDKPCFVVINKMDLQGPASRDPAALRDALAEKGVESLPVSALTGEGLDELKWTILRQWEQSTAVAD